MNKIRINSIIICLSEIRPVSPSTPKDIRGPDPVIDPFITRYDELKLEYWGGASYYERAWGTDQWNDITSRGVCNHYKGI